MVMQPPRTQAQVLQGLLELTPKGWALPSYGDSVWGQFLTPIAAEFALIETTAAAMVAEIAPGSAVYTLPDYQRVLGPDPYGRDATSLGLTTAQLQALAQLRWTETGNMAPSDYIALAASMGVTITITQGRASISGVLRCGHRLSFGFTWIVSLPTGSTTVAAAIAGEAPSHTNVVFQYH